MLRRGVSNKRVFGGSGGGTPAGQANADYWTGMLHGDITIYDLNNITLPINVVHTISQQHIAHLDDGTSFVISFDNGASSSGDCYSGIFNFDPATYTVSMEDFKKIHNTMSSETYRRFGLTTQIKNGLYLFYSRYVSGSFTYAVPYTGTKPNRVIGTPERQNWPTSNRWDVMIMATVHQYDDGKVVIQWGNEIVDMDFTTSNVASYTVNSGPLAGVSYPLNGGGHFMNWKPGYVDLYDGNLVISNSMTAGNPYGHIITFDNTGHVYLAKYDAGTAAYATGSIQAITTDSLHNACVLPNDGNPDTISVATLIHSTTENKLELRKYQGDFTSGNANVKITQDLYLGLNGNYKKGGMFYMGRSSINRDIVLLYFFDYTHPNNTNPPDGETLYILELADDFVDNIYSWNFGFNKYNCFTAIPISLGGTPHYDGLLIAYMEEGNLNTLKFKYIRPVL